MKHIVILKYTERYTEYQQFKIHTYHLKSNIKTETREMNPIFIITITKNLMEQIADMFESVVTFS